METYYTFDGEIKELRLPKTEVKNNRWEGMLVATSINDLVKLISKGGN